MFAERVLGIDPGLSRCGVAVVDGPGHRPTSVHSDVVRTSADDELGQRLAAVADVLDGLIRAHRPQAIAVERVFIGANAPTGVGAAQVAGIVHLAAARHGIAVTELTPSQVKAAVTGVGDADKHQVAFMVRRLLRLPEEPRPADRADALAVALCALQQHRLQLDGALAPRLQQALDAAGPGLAAVSPRAAARAPRSRSGPQRR